MLLQHNGPLVWAVSGGGARPATGPGSSAGNCPGGQAAMAQFLHPGKWAEVVLSRQNCQGGKIPVDGKKVSHPGLFIWTFSHDLYKVCNVCSQDIIVLVRSKN